MRRKINKRLILAAVIGLQVFYPATGFGTTIDALEAQLKLMQSELVKLRKQIESEKEAREGLEDSVEIVTEETGDLNTRIDKRVKVSGYADVEYSHDSRPSHSDGFRVHHFSLFFTKQFTNKLHLFSEIEFEDGPKFEGATADGKIFLEAVNINYDWRSDLGFRVGRFFTPAGIWSEDHYPPFVTTQARPGHIRKIFPQLVDGAMIYGTKPVGKSFVNYNLYVGNGEGNTGHNDEDSHKAVGGKVSFLMSGFKHLEFGGSFYDDKLNSGDEVSSLGVHGKLKAGSSTVQVEYADRKVDPLAAGDNYHLKGYYGQFAYDIRNWTLGYRYDFYDSNTIQVKDKVTNSLFANYHVTPNFVMKLEYHDIGYDDPATEDYNTSTLSGAYYFD